MEAQLTIKPKINQDFKLEPVKQKPVVELNSNLSLIPGIPQPEP